MRLARTSFCFAVCLLATVTVAADHHAESNGPNGGFLVKLGDGGYQVELVVRGGQTAHVRVLKGKRPVATGAEHLTFTFTEPDGEKEDYKVTAAKSGKGILYERKSAHFVHHIVRDKMSIKLNAGGKVHASETFAFPYGPNGGELISLGKPDFHAELVIDGDIVRVHVLNDGKRPRMVDAKELTLTFTEKDGEKEDYEIPVGKSRNRGTVFELDDDHVVEHIRRDKMSVKLSEAGATLTSRTFNYPKR